MQSTSGQHFGLAYLDADELGAYLAGHAGHILGVIGFGSKIELPSRSVPLLWVDIPVLGGRDNSFEVWTSDAPASPCVLGDIEGMQSGDVLFGSITLPQRGDATLEQLTQQAYTGIFKYIEHFGYRNLLRVWNYFPYINDDENGLERYRGFNVGRHAAFVECGRNIGEEHVPAASALGSNSGELVIYFIASKQSGMPVENPRQTSAFHYPKLFGPRSPIFVRAMSATLGGQHCFFISGTASIVGYETLHLGDTEKQTSETLNNIHALLQQDPHLDPAQGRMLFKVYVRHEEDMPVTRAKLEAEFGTQFEAVYLHSNICRSDLLLEIEGAYFKGVD